MDSNKNILVSISCITYNHAPYIRQCLDGFLMQKTSFKYEVLIHDDASTDGTEEIIREYEAKYPDIIKPLYEKENQWVLGRRGSAEFNYPRAKGKYIALCEGDDYWIDPYKLQKQVDYMDQNPEYSMCFHNAIEHWEDGLIADRVFSNVENRDYSAVEIYEKWTIPTASVVFRKKTVDSNRYKEVTANPKFIYGDIILFLTCSEFGKLKGFSDRMSVYRKHEGGIVFKPSLQRDYYQCLHDLEVPEVFETLNLKRTAYHLCFNRAFNGFLYTILINKDLNKKFVSILLRTSSFRRIFYMPRMIASRIYHPNRYN